jgi:hypothetical protein
MTVRLDVEPELLNMLRNGRRYLPTLKSILHLLTNRQLEIMLFPLPIDRDCARVLFREMARRGHNPKRVPVRLFMTLVGFAREFEERAATAADRQLAANADRIVERFFRRQVKQ